MTSDTLIVYTKDNCPACSVLKAKLVAQGRNYLEINVSQDAEALAFLKAAGHRSVPVAYSVDALGNKTLQHF